MKKIFYVILLLAAVFGAGSSGVAEEGRAESKIIAYYFHGSFRCITCTSMEKYSREAIETNFKDALESGKLEFKSVNVEEPDNEHYADDYQLYTKTLILSLVKNGEEIKSKNLDKIWEYARNKQKFISYVAEELNNFLKEAQ
ncbi:MAG: nitrophenyl compound nitroreductase subunit ArsF family protein [Candidatus Omnitrophota bacterium]